ncbi:MAG: M28 family peptidase [Methanobacteriaceae archaeon]|nr:M28 family peptidase [Methanobacteriaceae archaeon]
MCKKLHILMITVLLLSGFFLESDCVFGQEELVSHVKYISTDIGPRPAGSPNEEKTAQYLSDQFRKNNLKTEMKQFKYFSLNSEDIKTSYNVIGTIEGISNKEIIICADLDTVQDYMLGQYTSGANDDATGLAILIGLAQKYKNKKPFYTIKLIGFGASEDSFTFPLITPKRTNLSPDAYYQIVYLPYLVGARQYLLNNQESLNNTVAVISLEAVGIGDPCVVSKDYYANNNQLFVDFLVLNARLSGIKAYKIDFMASQNFEGREGAISHVYLPFSIAKIPSTFITCMNNPNSTSNIHNTDKEIPGYLSTDDTYDKLVKYNNNQESLESHLNIILNLVDESITKISLFNIISGFK